ncbi:MAG: transporter, family, fosmidomycin resistance protein [Verrucomicrobiota bacterium]|nr:transporter, family, fosmidomycin resistance protein [Verrucomicrobiota bacterium]
MPTQKEVTGPISTQKLTENTVFAVLIAISVSHLLNDTIQSVIPAIYPILKESFHLSFTQIGLITLTFQLTASLLQPFVGLYTDHRPKPYSLAIGMGFTLVGLVLLSRATNFPVILCSAALVGMGSSVFHPEASRLARMASGGRHGFAQSIFQVGGNAGTSLGPLLAALIIVPSGQQSVGWFSLVALVAIIVLANVGHWYKQNLYRLKTGAQAKDREGLPVMSRSRIIWALAVLIALMFSKFFYLSSMTNYFTFYLIDKFRLSVQEAQLHLFLFLFSVAAGTIIGGHLGDRFGRKYVIWGSILGVAPFTLLLPYANLFWTGVLTIVIGIILASAFSAILVYAQELVPGKVGMISGLFFGFAFGMGGIGSAALGRLADQTSINFVFLVCSFLPLIGLLTAFLPDLSRKAKKRAV